MNPNPNPKIYFDAVQQVYLARASADEKRLIELTMRCMLLEAENKKLKEKDAKPTENTGVLTLSSKELDT